MIRKGKTARDLSLPKLLPNILTTIGLCSGLTGIRFAIENDWQNAVLFILLAACFDLIDGLSARLLKAFSRFGAELDSLADAISFGVAPTIITYLWIKQETGNFVGEYIMGWYWIPFLFYSSCLALRLARFNVMHMDETKNTMNKAYFLGVPAPAGAGLILMPIILDFVLTRFGMEEKIASYPQYLVLWVSFVGVLMISRIPTFSFRNVRFSVSKNKAMFVLIIVVLVGAVFLKEKWICLLFLGLIYLLSLPLSYWAYQKDSSNKS